MAVLSDKSKVRRRALRALLVGDAEDRRLEVKTALAALGDPPLEIIETAPGLSHPSKAGPPPDVTMVLFYGGNEEASLNYLQSQSEGSMRPVLFALVQERSPVLIRRILRAGADELLFLPLDAGDATRALLNISDRKKPSSPSRGRQVDPRKEYGEFDGIRSVPERHGSS